MKQIKPAYFYNLGFSINSVTHLRDDVPGDLRQIITSSAGQALAILLADDSVKENLPQAHSKAVPLVRELALWAASVYDGRTIVNYEQLRRSVEAFSTTITDELDRTFCYVLTDKGNLSVNKLVAGGSAGYPADVIKHLNGDIIREIDEAGRCLACTLSTACGFHILRSVEIGIKGYVHALTGSLPALNHRNWGEYIDALRKAGASSDVTDVLRVLKTKRNPLMHPQDSLSEAEAIDIFCLCQATTGSLIKEVKDKSLETKFAASLALLPTL